MQITGVRSKNVGANHPSWCLCFGSILMNIIIVTYTCAVQHAPTHKFCRVRFMRMDVMTRAAWLDVIISRSIRLPEKYWTRRRSSSDNTYVFNRRPIKSRDERNNKSVLLNGRYSFLFFLHAFWRRSAFVTRRNAHVLESRATTSRRNTRVSL